MRMKQVPARIKYRCIYKITFGESRDRVHATLLTCEAEKACWTGGTRPAEGALRIISSSLILETLKLPASCDSHVTFRNTRSSSLSRRDSPQRNTKDFFKREDEALDIVSTDLI